MLSMRPPSPAPPDTPRVPMDISLTYTFCPGRTPASLGFSIRFLETWDRWTMPDIFPPLPSPPSPVVVGRPEGALISTTTPKSSTRWTIPE